MTAPRFAGDCAQCGKVVPEAAAFCGNCGAMQSGGGRPVVAQPAVGQAPPEATAARKQGSGCLVVLSLAMAVLGTLLSFTLIGAVIGVPVGLLGAWLAGYNLTRMARRA